MILKRWHSIDKETSFPQFLGKPRLRPECELLTRVGKLDLLLDHLCTRVCAAYLKQGV